MRLGQLKDSLAGGIVAWGILFVAFTAFYATTYSFRDLNDTDLNSYQTRALVLHGDVDLARYAAGDRGILPGNSYSIYRGPHLYSITSVAVSLSAAPLYLIFARTNVSDLALQAAASIPFIALAALLLFRLLLRLVPRATAIGASVIYAFGTTMWPVAAMGFFQHGPASLYQVVGLTGLFSRTRRGAFLAGAGFGAAAWVRPQLVVPLALVGLLYLTENRRSFILYAAGVLPSIAGVLVQNRWIWGSWLTTGYNQANVGWNGHVFRATYQLLFGSWRGIFVYSPVLIVGAFATFVALGRWRQFIERRMVTLGLASMLLVLTYARRSDWTGGLNQFGYRYLLDIVPFLVVLLAYGVTKSRRLKTIALPLGALSIMTMNFGAESNHFGWDGTRFPRSLEQSPIGQSWIVFVHRPMSALLRFLGIACIAWILAFVASKRRANEGLAPAVESTLSGEDAMRMADQQH